MDDMFKLCFVSLVRAVVQNFVNVTGLPSKSSKPARKTSKKAASKQKTMLSVNLDLHDGESLCDLDSP